MPETIEHYLSVLFAPKSIAVIGASLRPNSVGTVVFRNLVAAGFPGRLFAVNPKYHTVEQQTCYRSVADIPEPVELAIIATPAHTVPEIFHDCGRSGVKAAVVFAGGFGEAGEQGQVLEETLVNIARSYNMRFVGPNSLGIAHPTSGVNATFAPGHIAPGNLALVSQSGAVCTAVLDWAAQQDIGFSSVISTGISADLDFGEILDFLVSDAKTRSILLYVEGIRDARSFMSGLRAAARVKPVIVVKAGRHKSAIKVTQSHNSVRVGSDDVFDAALKRAGVVRGMHLGDLLAAANILSRGIRLRGENLTIVTNGGGPAAMACDRASDLHIPLAELTDATVAELNKVLPAMWSHSNPVDILGDADPVRYNAALQTALQDSNSHGLLVMLTPQATTDTMGIAHRVIDLTKQTRKPVIACWMGEHRVAEARQVFANAGIPNFRLPETAVQAFAYLTSFFRNQKLLLQTPGPISQVLETNIEDAHRIIEGALEAEHQALSETESKAILAAFGVNIAPPIIVTSQSEAVDAAQHFGLPVAMKIHGRNLVNKTALGGVQLNVRTEQAVRTSFEALSNTLQSLQAPGDSTNIVVEPMVVSPSARELRIAIEQDAVFGPVICISSGGTSNSPAMRAVSLPPLNRLLALDLIAQSPLGHYTVTSFGVDMDARTPLNLDALVNCLLSVSEIACELPEVAELEIDPLLADEQGVIALDAHIRIRPKPAGSDYSHTAIHPYPSHAEQRIQIAGNQACIIRPIRPEDAEIERAFVEGLSESSKQFRFMNTFRKLPPEMLAKLTQIDYDREMAFVAVIESEQQEQEIGVARYAINIDGSSCEFAITVADQWQGKGVATQLMEALMSYASYRGLTRMQGEILADNQGMQALAKKMGFALQLSPLDKTLVLASIQLPAFPSTE